MEIHLAAADDRNRQGSFKSCPQTGVGESEEVIKIVEGNKGSKNSTIANNCIRST